MSAWRLFLFNVATNRIALELSNGLTNIGRGRITGISDLTCSRSQGMLMMLVVVVTSRLFPTHAT
jgi:hypothetical protein